MSDERHWGDRDRPWYPGYGPSGGAPTGLFPPFYQPCQTPSGMVQTSGHAVPGHVVIWTSQGVLGDGGSTSNPRVTELGIQGTGLPLAITDAPPSGPHYRLSFGANVFGGGLISFRGEGGAPLAPLRWHINDAWYEFPFTTRDRHGRFGNVVGPEASAVGEITSWNNTTGSLLRSGAAQITDQQTIALSLDGAALAGFSQPCLASTTLLNQIYGAGTQSYDAVRGVANAILHSSIQVSGVGGYATNANDEAPAGALYGAAVGVANGSSTYGLNLALTDNAGQFVSTGTSKLLYNKISYNVTSPATVVSGIQLDGNSLSQPAYAAGFSVDPLGGNIRWSNAFVSNNNAATNFAVVGTSGPMGTNAAGQPLYFNYGSYVAAASDMSLQVVSTGQGPPSATGQMNINGGNFAVTGGVTIANAGLEVNGLLPGSQYGLSVSTPAYLAGGLSVTGTVPGTSDSLWVNGNTELNGNSSTSGNSTVGGNSTVDGNSTVNGSSTIAGNLSVGGTTTVNNITINGALSTPAGQSNTFSGPLYANAGLSVSGTIPGTSYASIINGNEQITQDLFVGGGSTFDGALDGQYDAEGVGIAVQVNGTIRVNGNIVPQGDNLGQIGFGGSAFAVMTSYNFVTASDVRLKDVVGPIPVNCLDLVRMVEPKAYTYLNDLTGQIHWGLLAQDVEAAGGLVETDDEGMLSLSLNNQIAVLWAAVRALAGGQQ